TLGFHGASRDNVDPSELEDEGDTEKPVPLACNNVRKSRLEYPRNWISCKRNVGAPSVCEIRQVQHLNTLSTLKRRFLARTLPLCPVRLSRPGGKSRPGERAAPSRKQSFHTGRGRRSRRSPQLPAPPEIDVTFTFQPNFPNSSFLK